MNKELSKKNLNEVIRLSKKYYKTGDRDLISSLHNARTKCFGDIMGFECDLIDVITRKRRDYNEPYETYYKTFEFFGYKIVSKENVELPDFNSL